MSQELLVSRLTPIATRIRTLGSWLLPIVTRVTDEYWTPPEFEHLSLAAAFEAFTRLEGDADRPEDFDWAGKAIELERVGTAALRETVMGRGSEFEDIGKRSMSRTKDNTVIDQYCWSSWAYRETHSAVFSQFGGNRVTNTLAGRGLEYTHQAEAESVLEHDEIAPLTDVLGTLLDPESCKWLVERYRDGVSQETQIDAFVADHPEYEGQAGRKRAANFINQRVSRARRRAAELLDSRWATLAKDVVAC